MSMYSSKLRQMTKFRGLRALLCKLLHIWYWRIETLIKLQSRYNSAIKNLTLSMASF